MKYYHGSSISNLSYILPPIVTNTLREDFRKSNTDVVFITVSKRSAEAYARKCVTRFGDTPVVYEVKPVNLIAGHDGEYVCEKAIVLSSYKLK